MTLRRNPRRRPPCRPARARARRPGSRRPGLRFAPHRARLALLRLPRQPRRRPRFRRRRPRAAAPSPWSANPPPPKISPRPGSRWNTAAAPSPSPPATSTAGPTSASASPASPAPTAKPPRRYLVDSVLRAAGHTTAMIGTIEYHLAGRVLPAVNTTPESLDLLRIFAELEQLGGSHATMEVSSHALALGRVYGLHFHTALFTNLTRDHLDFHGTMDEYFAAKQLLFYRRRSAASALRRPEPRRRSRAPHRRPRARSTGTAWGRTPPCAPATSPPASTGCVSRCSTASCASPWNPR